MKYANKRKTFGKKLIEHPVIRLKLAHMARQIEAPYNWLENCIYQCEKMGEVEAMLKLGGANSTAPSSRRRLEFFWWVARTNTLNLRDNLRCCF
jgi:alkylation response protein AidB-like acyl-CoA dehydrogenase